MSSGAISAGSTVANRTPVQGLRQETVLPDGLVERVDQNIQHFPLGAVAGDDRTLPARAGRPTERPSIRVEVGELVEAVLAEGGRQVDPDGPLIPVVGLRSSCAVDAGQPVLQPDVD